MMNITNTQAIQLDFWVSALHEGDVVSTGKVLEWMKRQNQEVCSQITQVPLHALRGWKTENGRICHQSGKFFSIDGIRVHTNYGLVPTWEQPIINQPEIGFLGFITKKINGVLHFLLQAKIEPGNLNVVQLSPTLQATRSNYTRAHRGSAPLYLEYFTGEKPVRVLADQLQSEQGARFLHKRNRNIIVEVDEKCDLPVYGNYIWLTLGQIKKLLDCPNIVNMDTRTVISCINYGSYAENELALLSAFGYLSGNAPEQSYIYSLLSKDNHLHDLAFIIRWITSLKFNYELNVERCPLEAMDKWRFDGNTIEHEEKKYFSVIGVDVRIGNREVVAWDQPMVKSAQEGIIGFLIRKIDGIYHFLVQAKLEAGNFDIVELAPTVQCLTGNYRKDASAYDVPYLNYFLDARPENTWYSTYQSEEGGRFFREQNLNMIVEADPDDPVEVRENYCWMTLNQLQSFVVFNNYLNIAARSLLSVIKLH